MCQKAKWWNKFYFYLLKFIYYLLEYSWFTVLCQSLLYSKVTQLCTYIHSFFKIFFSIMVYRRILNIVPCAIQKDLVSYHSIYNSLYLLAPNSQSNPPPPPPLWQPRVCSLCLWVCFCFIDFSFWHILDSTYK